MCAYARANPLRAGEPLDGLQRWQSALQRGPRVRPCRALTCFFLVFVILISVVVSQLLVNIWMFYAKGAPLSFV